MSLTLYSELFWISPYVFTCFVALREKGIAFDVKEISLGDGEHLRPPFCDASLTAKVPALEHDGFWIGESMAIVEYIEEAFPAPRHAALFPSSIHDRARARQLMAWVRSDLLPLKEVRPTTTMFYEHATTALEGEGRKSADKLIRVTEQCLSHGGPTLFERWSIADADLAFHLHRLVQSGDELPPRVRAYAEAQWARPAVKEFVQHPRKPYVPYG